MDQISEIDSYRSGDDRMNIDTNEMPAHALDIQSVRAHLRALQSDQRQALQRNPDSSHPEISEPDEPDADHLSTTAPRRRATPRLLKIMLLVLMLPLFIVGGLHFWNYISSYEWTDDAQIDGHLNPISSRIDGTVVRVYVENTAHVTVGQPLVDIDPRDYQVAVEQARGRLAAAEAALKAARQDYDVALANLAQARATNVKAQHDVERYRELFASQVVSRDQYEEQIKVGRVNAAAVKSGSASVAAASGVIAERQAAVETAQAALDQALLNLSYTHIVAPVSGVIGEKTVEVGQRLQPGEEMLAIVPLDDIWVTADFRETQLRKMRRGQAVTIHVDATGHDYKGYVEGLPGASGELYSLLPPENATGNYVKVVQRLPVRIRFYPRQDIHHRLRPGMSVEPTVWLNAQ